jgi:hypothetical protein
MKIKMKKTRRTVLDRLWPMIPALLARPQTSNQPAWPMPASTRGAVTVLRVAGRRGWLRLIGERGIAGAAAGARSSDGEPV